MCCQWEHSADIRLAPFGTAIFAVKEDPKPKVKAKKTAEKEKLNNFVQYEPCTFYLCRASFTVYSVV